MLKYLLKNIKRTHNHSLIELKSQLYKSCLHAAIWVNYQNGFKTVSMLVIKIGKVTQIIQPLVLRFRYSVFRHLVILV